MAGFREVGFSSDRVEETQGNMKRHNGPWIYSLRQKHNKKKNKYFIFDNCFCFLFVSIF
jgi:hypothetical protein